MYKNNKQKHWNPVYIWDRWRNEAQLWFFTPSCNHDLCHVTSLCSLFKGVGHLDNEMRWKCHSRHYKPRFKGPWVFLLALLYFFHFHKGCPGWLLEDERHMEQRVQQFSQQILMYVSRLSQDQKALQSMSIINCWPADSWAKWMLIHV